MPYDDLLHLQNQLTVDDEPSERPTSLQRTKDIATGLSARFLAGACNRLACVVAVHFGAAFRRRALSNLLFILPEAFLSLSLTKGPGQVLVHAMPSQIPQRLQRTTQMTEITGLASLCNP